MKIVAIDDAREQKFMHLMCDLRQDLERCLQQKYPDIKISVGWSDITKEIIVITFRNIYIYESDLHSCKDLIMEYEADLKKCAV